MRVGGGAGEVVTDSDRTPWNTRRRDWGGELHIALIIDQIKTKG